MTPTDSIRTNRPNNQTIQASGVQAGLITQHLLKTILDHSNVKVEDISVANDSLEDVFLRITGQTFSEAEHAQTS